MSFKMVKFNNIWQSLDLKNPNKEWKLEDFIRLLWAQIELTSVRGSHRR